MAYCNFLDLFNISKIVSNFTTLSSIQQDHKQIFHLYKGCVKEALAKSGLLSLENILEKIYS